MKIRYLVSATLGVVLLCGLAMVKPITGDTHAQDVADKERGKAVFNHWCTPCHAPGPGHPGTQSLAIKYRDAGIPAVLEDRDDLAPEFVKTIVRVGIMSMAPFRKTEITDTELEDIATYLAE